MLSSRGPRFSNICFEAKEGGAVFEWDKVELEGLAYSTGNLDQPQPGPFVAFLPRCIHLFAVIGAQILFVEVADLFQLGTQSLSIHRRSEERRVGKECRSRWSPYH